MKDNSKVILNLLAGVAAGAALGILFAPSKGRNSRRKVDLLFTNFSDTLIDNAENQYNLLDNLKDSLKYALRERLEQQRAKISGK
jgi:gas vesicle protein